ncbi:MAG: methylenetetrahydrofolate reductase C-terminal domain-containing protein [Lentisphaeria bacterium]|nr:methylenetetrahydrofolate reductase C-terminal domain-containing protein [Lentisphaeria bacterium]
MSEFQLDMTLHPGQNPLKEALDTGKFIFLAECSPPENELRREAAVDRIVPLAETMAKQEDLCGGLAITDYYGAPWSAAEIASALPEKFRNRNLYYLSGCSRDADAVAEQLNIAANAGVYNIVPVSGNASGLTARECRARNFCDSTRQLQLISGRQENFFAGVQFNPFHYDRNTAFASWNSLAGKIKAGAQFIVSQSGWDMLQNQSLAWYLLNRQCYLPLIAHLTLLTPDKAEKIISGKVPGVRMTAAFRKLLEQELSGSKAQFESAQYRRIELQSAGCRLMGYSGVQISGVDFPGKAQTIAARIRAALQEFRTFEHWLDEYNAHQAGAEMGGGVDRYHLYDRVLRRPYPFDEPPAISNPGAAEYSWQERAAYHVKRFFFAKADKQRPGRDFLLKKLLTGCPGCTQCTLPQNDFICIQNCPKRLTNGPCGAVNEDGRCEICDSECVFVKKVRCSRWREGISCLESGH